LRHSYVALLEETGASLKQAMNLARHSDPKLTMARYGKPQLADLGTVVERLPSLLPDGNCGRSESLAPTGTDGTPAREILRPACANSEAKCNPMITSETRRPAAGHSQRSSKAQPRKDLRTIENNSDSLSRVPPAGFEPAALGLGNRCSIP